MSTPNNESTVWAAISELKQDNSVVKTDIRGIYAGMDEIRDVLVRMQENSKPNLGGMFVVLLATCTFLVTIGGLTMAPVFRELGRINDVQDVSSEILMERTGLIGRMQAETEHIQFELAKSEALSLERHSYQKDRMDRMQDQMNILKDIYINRRSE